MQPMLKSIRLDHRVLRVYYRPFLLAAYGLAVLISVLAKKPGLAIVVVMTMCAPIVGLYFLLYEKNNLSKLYGILPLGKRELVTGRYLYAMAFGLANAAASSLLAFIIAWAINSRLSQPQFLTYGLASFAYYCLYVAVQFPLYFKIPFSKIYLFSNLPIYLAAVVDDYFFRQDNPLQQVIQYFSADPARAGATVLGLALLLLVSARLSLAIYHKSEQ